MDLGFSETSSAVNSFRFDDGNFLSTYEQSHSSKDEINHDYLVLKPLDIPLLPLSPSPDNFAPPSSLSYDTESPDDQDSDPVLKFLNQILMEEDMEKKPSMFFDPLALRAAEKSLYEVIGQEYPPSPCCPINKGEQIMDSPDSFPQSTNDHTANSSSNAGSSSTDTQWNPGDYNNSIELVHPQDFSSDTLVPQVSSHSSLHTANDFCGIGNSQMNSFTNTSVLENMFTDSESILQFRRGMEEARKFLPPSNHLVIDLDKYVPSQKLVDTSSAGIVKEEKDEVDDSPKGVKGRKHQYPEDGDFEDVGRSSKQSAIYHEDVELPEMFDKVLLSTDVHQLRGDDGEFPSEMNKMKKVFVQAVIPSGTNSGRARAKKNGSNSVDLRALLMSCAQAVASDDRRTAYEQLKQINQHSSIDGDANQRLASAFAIGLQARLGGTGSELYASLVRRKITATEKLKAYRVYLSVCPFKRMSIFFANIMIKLTASEASTLHIVDFGILYGFQWPILIRHLSERAGGPPKLRITGIELPQPGFRPAEGLQETGCRLAKYCERFGVPFEYHPIATQNWEAIKLEDFKILSGEVVAVNCLFRFGRLLDEIVEVECPRDAVLNLIRKIKPDIFVNAVTSGSYNTPFFVTRFREALFHYSSLFDVFDTTLPRDNPQRVDFEQDFLGREVINVTACEGAQRVERPETYKQWHVRQIRAGFKPLPLNPEVMEKLRHMVESGYHKDFLFDGDSNWMLQGWKGRINCAVSCWVPSS